MNPRQVRFLLLMTAITCSLPLTSYAQLRLPSPSYVGEIRQKVGFTQFTVHYERPMQRGREIFGQLVPYGKPWKTGGGFANTISFDQDVSVGGTRVKKGTYLLVTIPGPEIWRVILSTDSIAFSKNKPYEEDKEVVRIEARAKRSDRHYEAMTIDLDVVRHDALFTISWDHTYVSFTVETGTLDSAMRDIHNMLESGEGSADDHAEAAGFIAQNLNLLPPSATDTAILLVNNALSRDPQAWMFRTKRSIYLFTGDADNYNKVTREWIAFVKREPGYNQEEVRHLEADLQAKKKR